MSIVRHHPTSPRRRAFAAAQLLLAVALLAAGQVAVVLHDADHPFHTHKASCAAFLGADTQQPSVAPVAVQTAVVPAHLVLTEVFSQAVALTLHPAFQPRAPPLLPTT